MANTNPKKIKKGINGINVLLNYYSVPWEFHILDRILHPLQLHAHFLHSVVSTTTKSPSKNLTASCPILVVILLE